MSNIDNNIENSHIDKLCLHHADVDLGEWGKHKLWYVGAEKEFIDLIKETFSMQTYKEALSGDNMVIIDAGAYIGDTAFAFHKFAKKIYAIEPSKASFECMLRNIKELKLDKVIPINKGLWHTTGKQRLYIAANGDTGACITPFSPGKKGFDIDVISMDDLFREYKLDHVDLLKMDIEGSEFAVLESKGFAKVVDKIDKIILEAHPFFIPGMMGARIWKIPYILDKYGFRCKVVNPDVNWNVRLVMVDGSVEHVPMRIFLAEREK